jgi:hypothetical protein
MDFTATMMIKQQVQQLQQINAIQAWLSGDMNPWKRPKRCLEYSKLNDKTPEITSYPLLQHLTSKTHPHKLFFLNNKNKNTNW